jgi:hypothetical protein
MDAGLLDTLVKLASLGASGVCIFAIFWIGWLVLHLPAGKDPERHKTLRWFMFVAVVIAVISGASGFANAKFNADEISQLEKANTELQSQFDEYKEATSQTIARHGEAEIKTKDAANALAAVLKSKEAYNLRHPSDEIQAHIDLLKTFLATMGVAYEAGD